LFVPLFDSPTPGHVRIVDFLRGFAALLVVILHFGNGGLVTIKDTVFSDLFSYGQYGVQIFFVISGFIIPYALHRSGYCYGDFLRHISRRFIRIDPPAYISVLFLFLLYYGAEFILGRPISGMEWPGTGASTVVANLTYTADYLGISWYSLVFWTLAIEFQFYVLVGFFLRPLVNGSPLRIVSILLAVLLLYYLPFYSFFKFGCFFVMGIVLFLEKEERLPRPTAFILMSVAVVACFFQRGIEETIFALFAVTCIRFFSFSTKFTDHLGRISFSLYLTHLFSGWTAEIFVRRFIFTPQGELEKLFMLLIYVSWAIVFATVYHRIVEQPFVRLSKRIKWKEKNNEIEIPEKTVVSSPILD
jgi:peptidoglycan/LPS O-acetylase OafA/YrhL